MYMCMLDIFPTLQVIYGGPLPPLPRHIPYNSFSRETQELTAPPAFVRPPPRLTPSPPPGPSPQVSDICVVYM